MAEAKSNAELALEEYSRDGENSTRKPKPASDYAEDSGPMVEQFLGKPAPAKSEAKSEPAKSAPSKKKE